MTTQTGRPTKKQNDFTGRQMQATAAAAADRKRIAAEQVAADKAAEVEEFENSVFDVTDPDHPIVLDEVVEVGVEMANDTVVVRVSEDIENMTVGYGNTYHFKAGGKYQVPKAVAERLEELGLVWH